jgi:hypothetical protein
MVVRPSEADVYISEGNKTRGHGNREAGGGGNIPRARSHWFFPMFFYV